MLTSTVQITSRVFKTTALPGVHEYLRIRLSSTHEGLRDPTRALNCSSTSSTKLHWTPGDKQTNNNSPIQKTNHGTSPRRWENLIVYILLAHKKVKTRYVHHPQFRSCNYHCRVPHKEGHYEPEREQKYLSSNLNLLRKWTGKLRYHAKITWITSRG